jgi:hypothetical protein
MKQGTARDGLAAALAATHGRISTRQLLQLRSTSCPSEPSCLIEGARGWVVELRGGALATLLHEALELVQVVDPVQAHRSRVSNQGAEDGALGAVGLGSCHFNLQRSRSLELHIFTGAVGKCTDREFWRSRTWTKRGVE